MLHAVPPYILALIITLAAEIPVVGAMYPRERLRMMAVCAVATAATNLAMHLVLPVWVGSYTAWLLVGESIALVGEAIAYGLASREHPWPRAMIASAAANTASFLAGKALWTLLA